MTDPTGATAHDGPGSRRARSGRIPTLPTVLASLACFAVMFEFLAFQLRAGHDPALGTTAGAEARPGARPRPVVIHRRIVVRRVVESAPSGSSIAVASETAGSTGGGSSTVAAPAAPAPAAPAPAPVTASS